MRSHLRLIDSTHAPEVMVKIRLRSRQVIGVVYSIQVSSLSTLLEAEFGSGARSGNFPSEFEIGEGQPAALGGERWAGGLEI
jgi:hypothetical protein